MVRTPRKLFNPQRLLRVLGGELMATDDFFRARLDGMVDPRHPLCAGPADILGADRVLACAAVRAQSPLATHVRPTLADCRPSTQSPPTPSRRAGCTDLHAQQVRAVAKISLLTEISDTVSYTPWNSPTSAAASSSTGARWAPTGA